MKMISYLQAKNQLLNSIILKLLYYVYIVQELHLEKKKMRSVQPLSNRYNYNLIDPNCLTMSVNFPDNNSNPCILHHPSKRE